MKQAYWNLFSPWCSNDGIHPDGLQIICDNLNYKMGFNTLANRLKILNKKIGIAESDIRNIQNEI